MKLPFRLAILFSSFTLSAANSPDNPKPLPELSPANLPKISGHAGNVFMEPAVLKFYLDGIQWALGDLDADATPKK